MEHIIEMLGQPHEITESGGHRWTHKGYRLSVGQTIVGTYNYSVLSPANNNGERTGMGGGLNIPKELIKESIQNYLYYLEGL